MTLSKIDADFLFAMPKKIKIFKYIRQIANPKHFSNAIKTRLFCNNLVSEFCSIIILR